MDPQCGSSPDHQTELRGSQKLNKVPPLGISDKDRDKEEDKPSQADAYDDTGKVQCCLNSDRLNLLKKRVEDAINERKTFTIKGGFASVRNALVQRGWLEKIELKGPPRPGTYSNQPTLDEVCCNLPPRLIGESLNVHLIKCEKMIISRLLQNHDVDFYWNLRKDSTEWQHRLNRNKIINRFSRSLFTSKEGLCLLLQQMYWHNEPGISYVRFPRCYTINFADQCTAFIEDFRLTACISLLKFFVTKIQTCGEQSIYSTSGKVPTTALQFAMDRCNEYISVQKHADLDKELHKTWDHEWEQFLTNFQSIVHKNEKFEDGLCFPLLSLESSAKSVLKNMQPFWPQVDIDGVKNIWILKPGNKCRGRDITLIKDVNPVVRVMNSKMKYVVQKYIERPLLIYKTKFDIRQWFLITSAQPLTIWMYRDCYLRFSSQVFNLDNFHESVHLTNHAVQHKYTNQPRDKALPDDNMWDNHTFKTYLRQIGQAEKWYKVIYPGMRECIIGAMLASQDTMDRRPNTFELYGADFMVAENYTPWLIEINSCPAMGPTTSVTARMCPQCFEDMVKVIVDRRRDPKADTGLFEMIYKQSLPQSPAYLGMTLAVRGRRIFKKKAQSKTRQQPEPLSECKSQSSVKAKASSVHVELVKNYNGPIIGNLIEELHESLFKRAGSQNASPERDDDSPPTMKLVLAGLKQQQHHHHHHHHGNQPTVSAVGPAPTLPARSARSIIDNRPVVSNRKARTRGNSSTSSTTTTTTSSNAAAAAAAAATRTTRPSTRSRGSRRRSGGGGGGGGGGAAAATWEQETASILRNNALLHARAGSGVVDAEEVTATLRTSPRAADLVNDLYISSIRKILPEIDATRNDAGTPNLHQNLYTVGLGYRNHVVKGVGREDVALPSGARSSLDVYCFKL